MMIESFFSSTPLSVAGRPIYFDEEVEIKIEESVSVLLHDNRRVVKELVPPGMLILTNVRLIIIASNQLNSATKSSLISAWVSDIYLKILAITTMTLIGLLTAGD